ncbi:MAG: hypothetical protein ACI4WT_11295, partial [Oligosphaeraceae bacterium]
NPNRALTEEETARREQVQTELETSLAREFAPEKIRDEVFAELESRLSDPAVSARLTGGKGDARTLLGIPGADGMAVYFAIAPTQSVADIQMQVESRLKEELTREMNLLSDSQARAEAEKKLPLITSTQATISVKTKRNQIVTGQITGKTKSIIKIGSRVIAREDLSADTRAQLWEDEHEAYLDRAVRAAHVDIARAYDKPLKQRMARELPKALLAAGYLPDLLDDEATAQSTSHQHWLARPALLQRLVKERMSRQDAFIRDFWAKQGYRQRKRPNTSEQEWVPADILRK